MTFKPKKCHIGVERVKFLGFEVSAEGVRPDPDRIAALRNMQFPESAADLGYFVGLVQYYSRYVSRCALLLAPLQSLANEKIWPSHIPEDARRSFELIIAELVRGDGPFMRRPDFNKPFTLLTDAASSIGAAGILVQHDEEGREVPLAFWSRRWEKSERHWAPIEHEVAASHDAILHFKKYLSPALFTLITDAEPLCWLYRVTPRLPQKRGRIASWATNLQGFDFTVLHRPGRLHRNVDALSRLAHLIDRDVKPPTRRTDATAQVAGVRPINDVPVLYDERVPRAGSRGTWTRTRIACLLFNSSHVLTVAGDAGGQLFPSAARHSKNQPLREAAAAALQMVTSSSPAEVRRFLAPYATFMVTERQRKYLLVPCSPSTFKAHISLLTRSPLRPRWQAVTQIKLSSFTHADDRAMMSRLGSLLQSWEEGLPLRAHPALRRACDGYLARCLHPKEPYFNPADEYEECIAALTSATDGAVSTTAGEPFLYPEVVLPDGRRAPRVLLASERSVVQALMAIRDHVLLCQRSGGFAGACPAERQAATVMCLDIEFNPRGVRPRPGVARLQQPKCDLVQVAIGPFIFIFDTFTYPLVLEEDCLESVPTLRHWLESDVVIKVVQACGADVTVFKGHGITLRCCFDTALADCLIRGTRNQRSLDKLLVAYLGKQPLAHKHELDLVDGLFQERPLQAKVFEYSWQDVAWCQSLFEAMRAQLVCANPATLENERRDAHILDLVYEQSRLRCEKGLHSCTQVAIAACDGTHLAFSKSTPLRSVLLKLERAGNEFGVVYRSPSGDPFIAVGADVPGERLEQPLTPRALEDRESSKLLLDASKRVL
jgi:hypothetical protein